MTRGQLPQRAGSLGLNGSGTAAAVPPFYAGAQAFIYSVCLLDRTQTNTAQHRREVTATHDHGPSETSINSRVGNPRPAILTGHVYILIRFMCAIIKSNITMEKICVTFIGLLNNHRTEITEKMTFSDVLADQPP